MTRKRRNGQNVPDESEIEEIPRDEQIRLIQESGIFDDSLEEEEVVEVQPNDGKPDFADEIFNTVILLIPFASLYVAMNIMVKQQYAQHPTFKEELGELVSAFPILALFIFYTSRYKSHPLLQAALSIASVASGARMIHLVNNGSWGVVIRQCPPLGVIWIYTIVQLPLTYACAALALVYGYVRYYNLKIIF
ncbi:hypothetical protein CPB86DRAFT_748068 [Serendipita vermifera]|nr:hypothetical protein CPB86DRAFT_748068 [Serendipita vermifera]